MRGPGAQTAGRLRKRADFLAAASGRRFHTERMTVQGRLRGDDALGLRFGLTVTKKVGHATERNRIKRRLRAAMQTAAAPYLATNADIVVIGRRDLLTAEYGILLEDLGLALRAVTKAKAPQAEGSSSSPGDSKRRGNSHA